MFIYWNGPFLELLAFNIRTQQKHVRKTICAKVHLPHSLSLSLSCALFIYIYLFYFIYFIFFTVQLAQCITIQPADFPTPRPKGNKPIKKKNIEYTLVLIKWLDNPLDCLPVAWKHTLPFPRASALPSPCSPSNIHITAVPQTNQPRCACGIHGAVRSLLACLLL